MTTKTMLSVGDVLVVLNEKPQEWLRASGSGKRFELDGCYGHAFRTSGGLTLSIPNYPAFSARVKWNAQSGIWEPWT